MSVIKFGTGALDTEIPHIYPDLWMFEKTSGPSRLLIAPSYNQIDLFIELSNALIEPFGILYVAVVPRVAEPGRYQSPFPLSKVEVDSFLQDYQEFFEKDGRHNIWLISTPESDGSNFGQIVYDRHNVIYAYGPLQEYKKIISRRGMSRGEISFNFLHSHYYNSCFDEQEQALLSKWDWKHFPLQDGDEDPP